MQEINYDKVYSAIPKVMGFDLVMKWGKWRGGYRLNGEIHPSNTKLACYRYNDTIMVAEDGEPPLTLWDWLLKYGGCNNHREVADRLLRKSDGFMPYVEPPKPLSRFVNNSIMERDKNDIGVILDGLFIYLSKLFGSAAVITAYKRYNITPFRLRDGTVGTCFWFVNKAGQVCHDNVVSYGLNGKRLKNKHPIRRFKVSAGYSNRCYFGEYLSGGKERWLMESEKSSVLCWLKWGVDGVATGGDCKLTYTDGFDKILPDNDSAGYRWLKKAKCLEWWKLYDNVNIGDDIGDVVMRNLSVIKR